MMRRRVEYVFNLYARGATVTDDMPLRTYTNGDECAVVVVLPTTLTFRPGGRPRYAHLLPDPSDGRVMGERPGYVRCHVDDWKGARYPGHTGPVTWWFKRDPMHARQGYAAVRHV